MKSLTVRCTTLVVALSLASSGVCSAQGPVHPQQKINCSDKQAARTLFCQSASEIAVQTIGFYADLKLASIRDKEQNSDLHQVMQSLYQELAKRGPYHPFIAYVMLAGTGSTMVGATAMVSSVFSAAPTSEGSEESSAAMERPFSLALFGGAVILSSAAYEKYFSKDERIAERKFIEGRLAPTVKAISTVYSLSATQSAKLLKILTDRITGQKSDSAPQPGPIDVAQLLLEQKLITAQKKFAVEESFVEIKLAATGRFSSDAVTGLRSIHQSMTEIDARIGQILESRIFSESDFNTLKALQAKAQRLSLQSQMALNLL